ncbi:hypothetical protein HanRHA438_Chr12g0539051 [Helianthus annuus]|nr:hypothetical protein HanRHA438_Chr12g0539051 [Helianthus annuus]
MIEPTIKIKKYKYLLAFVMRACSPLLSVSCLGSKDPISVCSFLILSEVQLPTRSSVHVWEWIITC